MTKYQLNILLDDTLDEDIKNYYNNYKLNYEGDSGIDLVCPEQLIVYKNGTIDFKLKCEMINLQTMINTSFYLYPRSSISNTPLMLANSVGIIDGGYRGNIMAKVKYISTGEIVQEYTILKSTKLFQICAPDLSPITLNIVKNLSVSTRDTKGFGSTGIIIN